MATVNKMQGMKPQTGNTASARIQGRMEAFRQCLAERKFPAKGSLANFFREELAKNKEERDKYVLLGRGFAEEFRLKFAKQKLEEHEAQYSHTEKFTKLDMHQADYMNFDQLVRNRGGWASAKAILGSLRCVYQCVSWPTLDCQAPTNRKDSVCAVEVQLEGNLLSSAGRRKKGFDQKSG